MLIELRFTKASPTFILNDDPSSPETILVYTLTSKLLMVGFVTPGRDFSGPSKLDIVGIRVLAQSLFIIGIKQYIIARISAFVASWSSLLALRKGRRRVDRDPSCSAFFADNVSDDPFSKTKSSLIWHKMKSSLFNDDENG